VQACSSCRHPNEHGRGTASWRLRRGLLTPPWWDARNSQYGMLKEWRVTAEGSFVDGMRLSGVTIDDLALSSRPSVAVRIGVDPNARHVGGLNLF